MRILSRSLNAALCILIAIFVVKMKGGSGVYGQGYGEIVVLGPVFLYDVLRILIVPLGIAFGPGMFLYLWLRDEISDAPRVRLVLALAAVGLIFAFTAYYSSPSVRREQLWERSNATHRSIDYLSEDLASGGVVDGREGQDWQRLRLQELKAFQRVYDSHLEFLTGANQGEHVGEGAVTALFSLLALAMLMNAFLMALAGIRDSKNPRVLS
jgi:hypothetical protein